MKTLYVVRHAKSSWDHPGMSDFDRPLNERGKRDAPEMGRRLKARGVNPSLMLSSPARRARATCRRIADVLGYPRGNIRTDPALYHADDEDLLETVRKLSDSDETVMIFGHNPGLTDFVNSLNGNQESPISNIPTCGIVAIGFRGPRWQSVDRGDGELLFFDFPKKTGD